MKPTGSSSDFGDQDEVGHDEVLQLFRQVNSNSFSRKRNETPVFFPGVVVDCPQASGFRA